MATLDQSEVRYLALIGAQARLDVLRNEEDRITRAFPELGKPSTRRGRPPKTNGTSTVDRAKPRRRAYNMSAAQRKAVSERMKKYWAARRKTKAK